jgi:hypothetical protein
MAVTFPKNARGPIIALSLPAADQGVSVVLRNNATGKTLAVALPEEWNGDDLTLNFARQTIVDQAGVDRSNLLSPTNNGLWTPEPLITGSNDLELEVVGSQLVAKDNFNQIAGNITGKALELGGTWQASGDVTDGTINTVAKTAQRTATADGFGEAQADRGRIFTATTPTLTNTLVQVDIKSGGFSSSGIVRLGAVARYTNSSNWIAACIASFGETQQFAIIKAVGGNPLQNVVFLNPRTWPLNAWNTIKFEITAAGVYRAWFGPKGELSDLPSAEGTDAALLGPAGSLKEGKAGFYDQHEQATALTREYDRFRAYNTTGSEAYAATATLSYEQGYM